VSIGYRSNNGLNEKLRVTVLANRVRSTMPARFSSEPMKVARHSGPGFAIKYIVVKYVGLIEYAPLFPIVFSESDVFWLFGVATVPVLQS
jgi:hypothetical protein